MKRIAVAAAISGGLFAAANGVGAATLWVPDQYATITQACEVAVLGDTVAINPGTYYEGYINVRAGVTVLGMGGDSTDVRVCPSSPTWHIFRANSGDAPVVLENIQLFTEYEAREGMVQNSNENLIIRRCYLHYACPSYEQWARILYSWSGNATIRRCHVDFGNPGAMDQLIFYPYRAGRFVLEDCVVQMNPYAYMQIGGLTGTTHEFTNNTILGYFFYSVEPAHVNCSLYMVNNIIQDVGACLPGHVPNILEWRYNCFISAAPPPGCGYQIGNFVADPQFCDPSADDYRLQPGSPCIGSGELGQNVGARLGVCWPPQMVEQPGAGVSRVQISGPWPNPTTSGAAAHLRDVGRISGEVEVLDVLGSVVSTASVATERGVARVYWDGRSGTGRRVPAGVYYLHLPISGQDIDRRIVVLK